MKIEAKFETKNNKLYGISSGLEISVDFNSAMPVADFCKNSGGFAAIKDKISGSSEPGPAEKVMAVILPWKKVEPETEAYDEAFLADFREVLKQAEENDLFVVILPSADGFSAEKAEGFTAAMKHAARRIKDCSSVVGFAVPDELAVSGFGEGQPAAYFIEELSCKHAHYVYFAKKTAAEKSGSLSGGIQLPLVLY